MQKKKGGGNNEGGDGKRSLEPQGTVSVDDDMASEEM